MKRIVRTLQVWLKGVLEPAEDPRQTFEYSYERQRSMLGRVQGALTEIRKTQARLASIAAELEAKLPLLQDQAEQAMSQGREDLARNALERRTVAKMELENIMAQRAEVELEERRLSLVESRLSSRIEAFYARQEVIAARFSAAEAQVQIQEALAGLSEELVDLGKSLDMTQERTSRMQAKAYAIDRLVAEGLLEAAVEAPRSPEFSPSVERQLERLRNEVEQSQD